MAFWSKRTFEAAQASRWMEVQRAFAPHFVRAMSVGDKVAMRKEIMLLIVTDDCSGRTTLFMILPDGEAMYEGFSPAQFAEIPRRPSLLVGNPIGYEELFKR